MLVENGKLFEGKKVLVIGDIALDRTFRCTTAPPGTHATHGSETIYDILSDGDDHGTVGASYNTLAFCRSLTVGSTLVTAVGKDSEGDRVEQVLREAGEQSLLLRLPNVQTVTRIRFFVLDHCTNRFELVYRFDKDPDIPLSYGIADQAIHEDEFLDRFESEVLTSDVVLFNDTDKGFLSPAVLTAFGDRVQRATSVRMANGLERPLVLVDPKAEWDKYTRLNVDVLKPNNIEACKALMRPLSDLHRESDLMGLGEAFVARYGNAFRHLVVTLGPHGAAVLNAHGGGAAWTLHPAIPPIASQSGVATHCGDMFSTALALALLTSDDLSASIDFANYAASLQFSKETGEKISKADLLAPQNVAHFRTHYRQPVRLSV